MKRISAVLAIVALSASPAFTASKQSTGQGQGQGQGTAGRGIAPQGVLAAMGNVKLELTISDQTAGGQPIKKIVTLLLAERGTGRVRSGGEVYRAGTPESPGSQFLPVTLNADAIVKSIDGDRILAVITVEYEPANNGPAEARRVSKLNQSTEVVLISGRPTLIVQAADPIADRKVTLEVTATIIR